ncbi:MAG: tannase/feruloyl esterase family alpha/beta hydrolase [Coriobacteriaceae bacterium]|nr:tannase/feruloyl esterase family alpha/beta hydrolase [Coriobacteriaceae bacterium]
MHWRVSGRILSLDPGAEPIRFRALFPQEGWCGKMLHIGGGGFDGTLPFLGAHGVGKEMWAGAPVPLARGFVVYGSDSGHSVPSANMDNWNNPDAANFSVNDEMLLNYAHAAIKKVHDTVLFLVRCAYGTDPERSYFAGSSNGGRQGLIAAQRYGDDYDGIICGYPAIHWMGMVLFGNHIANLEDELGEACRIDEATWARAEQMIISACDADDGVEDGLISNLRGARRREQGLLSDLAKLLNPAQMRLLEACIEGIDTGFLQNDEFPSYPGFAVLQGEPLRDDESLLRGHAISENPGKRDSSTVNFADAVISRQIMRDIDFDARCFDPWEHAEEVRRASALLDASSTDISGFMDGGGKIILYHGTYDQLISVKSTIGYYEALCRSYGRDALREHARLFIVPGAGHMYGRFEMGADLLGMLDAWVCEGTAPSSFAVHETNSLHVQREQLVCEYPYYARYAGGDPSKAASYEPCLDA